MNDVCCTNGDPASVLEKIQSLVANPDVISLTPERSPLFQIAARLEVSELPELPRPGTVAITEKIFASIRQEALKAQAKQYSNRPGIIKGQISSK